MSFARTIQEAVAEVVRSVSAIRAVYDYPVEEFARVSPVAVVLLQGASYTPLGAREYRAELAFGVVVRHVVDAKNAEDAWDELLDVADAIISAIEADPTLGGRAIAVSPVEVRYSAIAPEGAEPAWVEAAMTLTVTASRPE